MSELSRHRALEAAGVAPSAAPALFQARCGWKRTFQSASDAQRYDDGYSHWPKPMPHVVALSTPFSTGWFDAEHDAQQRDEDRQDAYDEARQR